MTTVAQALERARQHGVARLDAQLLLAHVLQRPRSWLLAHDDARLDPEQCTDVLALFDRRADGVPLAYLTGEREFHGLSLKISPAVLVPRPETEELVDWAIAIAGAGQRVIDLGTGSGAIALALKHARPDLDLTATDLSVDALAVARANADRLGLSLQWYRGAWWSAVPGRRFHLALSNPPYIASDDEHLAALRHEPQLALTPGGDGLQALREIVSGAPDHLHRDGWLMLEHGHDQADAVAALLKGAGFTDLTVRRDLAGHRRCSGGRRAGA